MLRGAAQYRGLIQHFRYHLAPCGLSRGRLAAVFLPGFLYMASPTKRLAALQGVGVLPRVDVQRDHMIALIPPRTAAGTASVAVALEGGSADGLPAAGI